MSSTQITYYDLLTRQRQSHWESGIMSAIAAGVAWIMLILAGVCVGLFLIGSASPLGTAIVKSLFPNSSKDAVYLFLDLVCLGTPVLLCALVGLEAVRYWFALKNSDRQILRQVGVTPGLLVLPMTPSTVLIHRTSALRATGLWAFKEFMLAPAHLTVDAIRRLTVAGIQIESDLDRIGGLCEELCLVSTWRPMKEFTSFADLIPILVVLDVVWVRMHGDVCEIRVSHHIMGELKDANEARRIAKNQPRKSIMIRLTEDPTTHSGFRIEGRE